MEGREDCISGRKGTTTVKKHPKLHLNIEAGSILFSSAASMVCCHVFVLPGITKPNSKNHSSYHKSVEEKGFVKRTAIRNSVKQHGLTFHTDSLEEHTLLKSEISHFLPRREVDFAGHCSTTQNFRWDAC
jgi:hypothetical protein